MEKLKIQRLGEVRKVEGSKDGRSYSFQTIGFISEQYDDRWYNFVFKTEHGLEVGKEYDFDIKETVKGDKTYYNASTPKTGSIDAKLLQDIFINTESILNRLTGLKLTLDALDARTAPTTKASTYPQESSDTEFDDFSNETPF